MARNAYDTSINSNSPSLFLFSNARYIFIFNSVPWSEMRSVPNFSQFISISWILTLALWAMVHSTLIRAIIALSENMTSRTFTPRMSLTMVSRCTINLRWRLVHGQVIYVTSKWLIFVFHTRCTYFSNFAVLRLVSEGCSLLLYRGVQKIFLQSSLTYVSHGHFQRQNWTILKGNRNLNYQNSLFLLFSWCFYHYHLQKISMNVYTCWDRSETPFR